MRRFLLSVLIFLPSILAAQALSGNYIIGSDRPFPFNTLTNAVSRINASGVNGPVVFLLDNTTFTNSAESFPIRIVNFPGSSATNTLTIRPNAGRSVDITAMPFGNGYTGIPAVFHLDGADNIIINGSNNASSTTRNLTIRHSDNIGYLARTAIWISSNGTNKASNISVLNCSITMTHRNQDALLFGGIYVGNNSVVSNNGIDVRPATAAISQLNFRNNVFNNVRQGIWVEGNTSAALQSTGIQVTDNVFGSTIALEKPTRAVYLTNVNNFGISANTFSGIVNTGYSGLSVNAIEIANGRNFSIRKNFINDLQVNNNSVVGQGIWLRGIVENASISENAIHNIKNTGNGIVRAIGLDLDGVTSANLTIANNMISDVASNGLYSNTGYGLYIGTGRNIKIYHNSIAMNTVQPGSSAALFINAGSELDVRNNIFQNGSTGSRYAIYTLTPASAFTAINNNNYFSSPIGFLGGDRASLANWKTATGKDQNSVAVNPVFTSVSNLRFANGTNPLLDNLGVPIAAVPGDIDGLTRSLITPDIGASEFSSLVLASQPTVQASAVSFTNVVANAMTINWTPGNGLRRLVVVRAGSTVNADPADGSAYGPSVVFANGSPVGTGNFVVHAAAGSSVTVTGLSANTTYHVAVYEYNGSGGTENYLLNAARGSRTTLNPVLGWQVTGVNTPQAITFDSTVSGVTQGTYNGTGFTPSPVAGQLNSNAWSVAGLNSGPVNFGSIATDGNASGGISSGNAQQGGIYAFVVAPDNHALGLQPDANNLNPGAVVLRAQNQTGAPITALSIGFKVYIKNNQAGSSNITFSHSADDSAYTAIPAIDVNSAPAANGSTSWKANYRVVTITGLSIPTNSYYYLRWSINSLSDTFFDEFALDDIILSANPTTNFASFSGLADSFIVHGNTSLYGPTTVENLTLSNGKLSVGSQTLTLAGPVNNVVAGGLRGGASSNLTLAGNITQTLSFDQTTPGTTNLWNNFTVEAGDPKTIMIQNNLRVDGNFFIGQYQTLDFGTNTLSGSLSDILVDGTLSTRNTSVLPLPAGKIWAGKGIINYNAASAAQRIVAGTYNGLTVSTPGGGIATGNININKELFLPAPNPSATTGALNMGSHTLLMGQNATNSGIGDVSGIVRRNSILPNTMYTFGHRHTSITFPDAGTLPSTMSLKIIPGVAPSWKPGAIKRTYDLIQTGASGTKAVIKSHYLDTELNGNTESRLVDWSHIVGPPSLTYEQGRSNSNSENNFVELTNVDIGLYFESTFGKVSLSMANSEAQSLTWTGQTSNSWTTVTNWSPNATPSDSTAVIIPGPNLYTNHPVFNPLTPIKSINIHAGAVVYAPGNSIATVTGSGGAWINNGQFIAAPGSKVVFTNPDATIAGTTHFNKLTIAQNASLRPTTGTTIRIADSLRVDGTLFSGLFPNTIEFTGSNQTVPVPNSTLDAYYNITVNGNGAVFPESLSVIGNLILNNDVNLSGRTISMNGVGPQLIGGTANADFDNLTINNTDGNISLQTSASVRGTLTMLAGNLVLGSNNLTLSADAVAESFGPTRMILTNGSGALRRKVSAPGTYHFPIGENSGAVSYSPISVIITEGLFSNAFVGVRVIEGVHPSNGSLDNNLSRYWELRQVGISGAVANLNATYFAPDVTGETTMVSSAVLTGAFDQLTNPWVKYQPLEGLLATVMGMPFHQNEVHALTGIKGADFSVDIMGDGTFCENDQELLTAIPVDGDAPYTYEWSDGLGNDAAAIPPGIIGTVQYSVTVRDVNGQTANAAVFVETVAEAVPGQLSANQTVCFGSVPSDIILSGNSAPVRYWERSDTADFDTSEIIAVTSSVLHGADAGIVLGDTYFRAAVGNGTCEVRYSQPILVDIKTTIWDGSTWSDGLPDGSVTAVIAADYNESADLFACSVTVVNNAVVVIPQGYSVTLTGSLIIISGSFTMENNAALVQISDNPNYGEITLKRHSSPLFRLDYTMWGSPLFGSQTLLDFSPLTVANRFYDMPNGSGVFSVTPAQSTFNPAKGYLIRMPNNHVAYTGTSTPQSWLGTFIGTPTNGTVPLPLFTAGTRYNMVANPYPSGINADELLQQNEAEIEGTIYFWRRKNNVPVGVEETNAYYATYTSVGGTAVSAESALTSEVPNGLIQIGQGFLVQSLETPVTGTITFNNSMRTNQSNTQFFRNSTNNRSRIWLNVTGPNQMFGQTLLAFTDDALIGVDRADGKYINDGLFALTSLIEQTPYIIQARPLDNFMADVVPMHFRTPLAGTFTMSIDAVDGLFENDQDVFVRDNANGVVHNLSEGAYTFTSSEINSDERFEILFQQQLGIDAPATVNDLLVYKKDRLILIESARYQIEEVQMYDISGRLLLEKSVDDKKTELPSPSANQTLIVKVKVSGNWIVRKLIN